METSRSDRRAASAQLRGVPLPPARYLLRAKDVMDRSYAEPLDIPALARVACASPAHFIRGFKRAFGETPHQYLMTRRIERAKALLRTTDQTVTEVCLAVGFTSLGSFSSTFRRLVGESPAEYRRRWRGVQRNVGYIPTCFLMMATRPRRPQAARQGHGS